MNAAYYNEIDPYAAQWLRNLIVAGHLPAGDVDERSIELVRPDDLRPYSACHFFAGIGGWAYALRLAEWNDDRPVWTGSCPCQPFSAAGKGAAADDERHLWPAWFSLIRECRPARILGEQVEAAIGWGWLDAVFADLEAEGYACASAVLPACSVGAPHIRQRLWFVADAVSAGRTEGRPIAGNGSAAGSGVIGELADTDGDGCGLERSGGILDRERSPFGHNADRSGTQFVADADAARCGAGRPGEAGVNGTARLQPAGFCADGVADASGDGRQDGGIRFDQLATGAGQERHSAERSCRSPWANLVWLPCSDGKTRPTQPGLFPLASGIPGRVGRLRAYGNAIVPQVAAEFIRAAG